MKDQGGVTLIELILVIVLIGIIGAVAARAFFYASESVLIGNSVREATQVNRLAIDRMIREIRNVRNNTCVSTATANSFAFVDADNNTITYDVVAGALRRNGDTLVGSVSNLAFTYYNAAGVDITAGPPATCSGANTCSPSCPTPTNIWRVRIDLTAQSGTETLRLRSQAHPRNF